MNEIMKNQQCAEINCENRIVKCKRIIILNLNCWLPLCSYHVAKFERELERPEYNQIEQEEEQQKRLNENISELSSNLETIRDVIKIRKEKLLASEAQKYYMELEMKEHRKYLDSLSSNEVSI